MKTEFTPEEKHELRLMFQTCDYTGYELAVIWNAPVDVIREVIGLNKPTGTDLQKIRASKLSEYKLKKLSNHGPVVKKVFLKPAANPPETPNLADHENKKLTSHKIVENFRPRHYKRDMVTESELLELHYFIDPSLYSIPDHTYEEGVTIGELNNKIINKETVGEYHQRHAVSG